MTAQVDESTINLLDNNSGGVVGFRTRAQQRISLTTKRRKMSRRANLIGICGVSGVCILLIIAAQQNTHLLPTSLVSSSSGSGGLSQNGYANGYNSIQQQQQTQQQNQQLPPMPIQYNLTATIADVLLEQRSKIRVEMENFEYPSGRFGVDAEKLSDLTPETEGIPVRSLIITTWRSGSTFLGDILNAMPGNFYHYEPLLNFGIVRVRNQEEAITPINNLKKLLYCDFTDMEEYLIYGKTHTYLFEHNERLWSVCKEFPHFCWRGRKFLTPFCKLFPLQSMKTVRLRLSLAEQLFQEKGLNIRIILLVRDPRGTMQSRKHREWCGGNPDCDDSGIVCEDLIDDYQAAEIFTKKYPSRFRTLRYEDLSLSPYEMTQEVLQFYGLPFDAMVEEFLDTHTKENIGGVSSTYRDSKSAPFHWKTDLKIDEINLIQENCGKAMELWGYRKIENYTDFQKTFDPIILPPPFT